ETTGSATINAGAQIIAKEKAIKNAMQQALMQTSAYIDSTSTISANVLVIDSARVKTSGTVEDVKVLDEWIEDEVYFVRIRATIPDNNNAKQPRGAHYRKKLAAIQFDISTRTQVYDLPDIERKLPRELLLRLDNTGNFITIDATQYLVSQTDVGYQFDNPDVYKMIAQKTGAQIILSGTIRNMSVEEGFLQDKRHLEIEIYLHDGLSGSRIARHRFSETITNAGYQKARHNLLSSASFAQSVYGKAVSHILATQVELIQDDLKTVPFTAKIIKINGKDVYFDAGERSRVNIGDMLMTFKLDADPLIGGNSQYLGMIEQPIASLSVEEVQAQFSVGKLEIKNTKLSPGDLIRFGR
ncbi:MAG: flagellar assembly protein T N-terminal domain-containing protein, partial [Gammaproteobacteria bacterium]|nr:flagellar assembly protein T N-terminal domain-containing protein [Gammaproteobacteria bacterium]